MDADEMLDYEDQDPHIPPTSTANLGPYARFLQNLPDYNDMTQESSTKLSKRFRCQGQDLHQQAFRFMQQLRQVIYTYISISYPMSYMISYCIFDIPISYPISYLISCAISYTIFSQAGLVLPLDKEAAGIITSSEAILKDFSSKHSLNASTINDLNKDVLKNPAFNKDEVDTDMLQQLQASIDRGDVQILNMHTEGGGEQLCISLVQALCISRVQGPAWQQTFCRALQRIDIFSISPNTGW
jgi:hypothetical protein